MHGFRSERWLPIPAGLYVYRKKHNPKRCDPGWGRMLYGYTRFYKNFNRKGRKVPAKGAKIVSLTNTTSRIRLNYI